MSRIHLLMLSMDESHSRWPGALSLWGKRKPDETAKKQKEKLQDDVLEVGGGGGKIGNLLSETLKTRGEERVQKLLKGERDGQVPGSPCKVSSRIIHLQTSTAIPLAHTCSYQGYTGQQHDRINVIFN